MNPAPRLWRTPAGALALAFLLVGAFRLWLAAALPFTADEAYFAIWGRNPGLGFYDHPPLIGWLLALLLPVSDAELWLRLPQLVQPPLVAAIVWWTARRVLETDEPTALLAALVTLLLPMNVWNVFVSTDSPLVVAATASVAAFAWAARRDSSAGFFSAGLLLGLAFLAKYFAVLTGLGFLAWAVLARAPSASRRWRGLGLVFLGALPAGLLNLAWNLDACWSNIMFNAINRHRSDGLNPQTPLLYAATLAYLAAPLFWVLWRRRAALAGLRGDPALAVLVLAWLVPLVVFALLAPAKRIGMHWLLSFLPALLLTVARIAPVHALRGIAIAYAVLAAVHVAVVLAFAAVPLEHWQSRAWYGRLVLLARTEAVVAALEPQRGGAVLAADAYSVAAVLAHAARREVPVFGPASSHARHDDIMTDWRRLDGRDLLVFRREPPLPGDYAPYFRRITAGRIEVAGATFHTLYGEGFDYAAYRRGVLVIVRDRYYRIPAFLPVRGCYFCERYFDGEACAP